MGRKSDGDKWFDDKTDKLIDDLKLGTDEESEEVEGND
jgi:hypothetical protein